MKTTIFTMTHKQFLPPDNKIYVPLHVGREGSQEFGYLGDNTGDSISDKNKYFGELTGIYWIFKNFQEAENIGVCHYRRYFLNENRQMLDEAEYERILSKCDVIVSNLVTADKSYQSYFGEAHNVQDLLVVGEVIKEKYPDYHSYFLSALSGNTYYYGNLLVTSKKRFDEYASWLFDILFEVEKRIDVSTYDLYNQRVFGFLSEQMLKIWIDANGLKAYQGTVGITAEKAETVEFKLAMAQLVKQGQINEARELFYGYLKLRPDVRLELSDVKGEIPIIEQLLYMMEQEEKHGIKGLLEYSNNLDQLIRHYRKINEILKDISERAEWKISTKYLLDTQTSWIQVKVILLNAPDIANSNVVIEQLGSLIKGL